LIDIETGLRVLGGRAGRVHRGRGSRRTGARLRAPHLIHVKRAAGRPKDLEAIAELQALLEERNASG
jgi:hypothetical protein